MNAPISVVSVNARGLRGRRKRLKVFNTLKEKFADAVFLFQETHSDKTVYQTWRGEWGSEIYLNHGESNSRGVMLAFSNNLEISNFKYVMDNIGRIQLCTFDYNNQKFSIGNIYNNNVETEQVKTLKKLSQMIEGLDPFEYEIIIGGDWNFIFDKILMLLVEILF